MNVNDKWMLEQMQQMAASMATTLPQTGQNSEPARTEKGESFQDLMNKAKDKQVEAPKKEDAPAKQETVQGEQPVQKAGQTQQAQPTKDNTAKVKMDVGTAALVAAGYVEVVKVFEDGSALLMLSEEMMNGGVAIVYGSNDLPTGAEELIPVIITNSAGEEITVTPKQIQEVFDSLGKEVPQKGGNDMTLVGQIDLSKYQDAKAVTADGKVTTLREAIAEAKAKSGEADDDADLNAEVMTASQPLFKDVKAAPVKVGENFQLDTQEPDMDQQLAETIRYAAQEGIKQLEIKLSPENLGNLTIRLTQASDGTLEVVLHATNAKAANLLSQNLSGLNAALQGYGQGEVRVEVQHNENSQQAEQQQQQQTDPDGHNRQQQEQRRRQESEHSGDFVQKLRLGLFGLEE